MVWMPVLVMVIGALAGAPLGVAATKYLKGAWLRLLYGVTLVLGGVAVDHLFAAAQAHWGEIAADDTAWQLLELPVEIGKSHHD